MKQAPADAVVAHAHLAGAGGPGDSVEDERARQDDVGPARVETDHGFAFGCGRAREPVDLPFEIDDRQTEPVHAGRIVGGEREAIVRRSAGAGPPK